MLGPVWSCGAALPNSLVDLLDTGDREEDEEKTRKDLLGFYDSSERDGD